MKPEYYVAIMQRLVEEYGLQVDQEHAHVTEFFEGPIPIFKLVMTEGEDGKPGILILSFHIELESPAAVQWFLRLRQLDPNLHMTACYIKDAEGSTYVGEDAAILRMYMIEQDVIAQWIASNKDEAETLEQELPTIKPSPLRGFHNFRAALAEFKKMSKKKGDISH